MKEWIISANAEIYDHSSSFEHFGFIDWRQGRAKFEINDFIYIYCTSPISSIQYKCVVEQINLKFEETRDDKEYWKNEEEYEKSTPGFYMRLKLIDQISNMRLNLSELKENGLNAAPQGPVKIKPELSDYLKINFTDNYQIDFFPEIISENSFEYEGLKKQITVNKYERSSKARDQCIEYNGLNCFVCGMDFYDTYGEIGKGFIHIHHLTPIHKIGQEYKIDFKKDLNPVCPNCHAMLHRKINGVEPTIVELKNMIKK
jgi:5-methylcytosine-specific restriction protein A